MPVAGDRQDELDGDAAIDEKSVSFAAVIMTTAVALRKPSTGTGGPTRIHTCHGEEAGCTSTWGEYM